MYNLEITVDRNTVKRILNDRDIEPAPERKRSGTPWKTFLEAHWDVLAAIDFFSVEVVTFAGIIRYYVLFSIRLETRDVQIVGITDRPREDWMKQMARNLTDPFDGFLRDICCTTSATSSWTGIHCSQPALEEYSRMAVRSRCDYPREVRI